MTVIDNHILAGEHEVDVMLQDQPAGVYFYTLQSAQFTTTGSMVKGK